MFLAPFPRLATIALQADLFYLFILIFFFKLNAERKIQSYEKADSNQIQLPDESDSLWQLRSMLQEMKTDVMSVLANKCKDSVQVSVKFVDMA